MPVRVVGFDALVQGYKKQRNRKSGDDFWGTGGALGSETLETYKVLPSVIEHHNSTYRVSCETQDFEAVQHDPLEALCQVINISNLTAAFYGNTEAAVAIPGLQSVVF